MAATELVSTLAKVVIAVAWADGELAADEVNALKDLLFRLPDLTAEKWAHLQIYLDSPVTEEEADALLDELLDQVRTEDDKELILNTLEALVAADGVLSPAENAMLAAVREAVRDTSTGVLTQLRGLLGGALRRRSSAAQAAVGREARLEDFLENTVYYELARKLAAAGRALEIPEAERRKLCLAGGLMAHLAHVDEGISDAERAAIDECLHTEWGLSADDAALVAAVSCHRASKGLDLYRLARGFYECSARDERLAFLRCLFRIANSAEKTSAAEIDTIRVISGLFRLSHKEFIDAKLTVPREDRGGL